MLNVLFSARDGLWGVYEEPLRKAFASRNLSINLQPDFSDPELVHYIVYGPTGPLQDFTPYSNAKAVLNLWAGVERLVKNPTLTIPLTRMVDTGLREGMVEYVTAHVLRHHLDTDRQVLNQNGVWDVVIPPLARDRTVAVLGLGALGEACARQLATLNFNVLGWSRRQKKLDGVSCFCGEDGLREVLSKSDIVVLLLPLTDGTANILNADTLALLPEGAAIVNPGRGALIDDDALLAALGSGQVGAATLDVFRQEPLPAEHPYWHNPKVTVTPHIASETRPETASEIIADNIHRNENGEPMRFLVDRSAGY
ncbi:MULTISPECIES: 2-hydroxyacid dehydrogenase [Halocynthiibacter]|uniref:Glyoxylate/hydroxypyruvate reductase A n=1 Tax=Halocynthiibacter halioticoli TaxID=2986804 RepID=A0AAE3J1I1_9RHOB|nr:MULTISPECIES: glyoxylate/hydroxypyruvate reductase A [Halocynthiibacter]MCV6823532.1 glyoxylate/hydroxypyruvate reductase A [Halocynthiibacter halioticoli]MCW4056533.1 glyoxylate/hydroxypyruvate reductase A [Halocynthiibacter sp. SDUM655004]